MQTSKASKVNAFQKVECVRKASGRRKDLAKQKMGRYRPVIARTIFILPGGETPLDGRQFGRGARGQWVWYQTLKAAQ